MKDLQTLKRASAVRMEAYPLTVLTPLMMHGWQQRVTTRSGGVRGVPVEAEARALSIKGILRYWWRTLQDEPDHRKLLAGEIRLFGGMAGDDKARRSPLSLRLEKTITSGHQDAALPHRSERRASSRAIKSGETFNLITATLHKDAALQREHHGYMTYMLLLAGFGQRARRGAGALQCDAFRWQSTAAFQSQLQEVLTELNRHEPYTFPALPSGPGLILQRERTVSARHPVLTAVWAGRAGETAESVRKRISEAGHVANSGRGGRQWLGSAQPKRCASPLHATVRQIGSSFVPIISEVSSPHLDKRDYQRARDQFLEHVGVNM